MRTGFSQLIFLGFLTCAVQAQTFTPVKDAGLIQRKLADASLKINSVQCDFTQEKNMSMLSDKVISRGKFYFKKESKVRLEYLEPAKNMIVMNAGKMMMKDDKRTTQTDMHRSRVFQQLNSIIVGSINGSLFNSKEFTVSFSENSTQLKAELRPVSKTLKNFLTVIILVLDIKDFTASRIEMIEATGDNTILSFSAKEINKTLDDTLFSVK